MTLPEALQIALEHHKAGRLAEAEALYRQILAAHPDHPDALHLLAMIAHQMGRTDLAIAWIQRALQIQPAFPAAHYNLANVLRDQQRFDEAIAAYRRAIELKPDFADAHHNLGIAFMECGQAEAAIDAYRRAVDLQPNLATAYYNLGVTLWKLGRSAEAMAAYRREIEGNPGFAPAHYNLGVVCAERGEFENAIAAYRRALELNPADPKAQNNLGNVFKELGRREEALVAYRRALELAPASVEARHNLGNVLKELGHFEEAVAAYRHALDLNPRLTAARFNLGVALRGCGRFEEAIVAFRQAAELDPGLADAHCYLGTTHMEQGQFDEAVAALRRALELKPDFAEACNNLGITLKNRGEFDEAIATYRHALELRPDFAVVRNNLGNALRDQGRIEDAVVEYRRALEIEQGFVEAQSNLAYTLHFLSDEAAIVEEHRRWNERFGEPLRGSITPFANDRQPERRLRIGYVSPDLRDHVVGRNLLPLFRHHDPRQYEILCYSEVRCPDPITETIRQNVAVWQHTAGLSDDALAEKIRQDRVDILVDLSQHMAGNRLLAFARQPAPVQVSFAGYPESTGLEAIEHRISDRWLEGGCRGGVPADQSMERVFLLDSFWCYDPNGMQVPVSELPALESGRVTFGCLNNFCKVNESMLRWWARVLKQIPDSRLFLLTGLGSHRQRTVEFLEREGIVASRVQFVGPRPRQEYLEIYHGLDLVLDTFPYNGHTTSLDALWMGVPVVALAGERAVARAGLSQLSNLGLTETVAFSKEDYVAMAVKLASDLPRLAELRRSLRSRMEGSVLMDGARFARSIEAAYRAMWRQWFAKKAEAS